MGVQRQPTKMLIVLDVNVRYLMKIDDQVRSTKAVVVSMREMEDGSSRLFFDDVASDKNINPTSWNYQSFYTFSKSYHLNEGGIEKEFTEKELANIGLTVLTRLLAHNENVSG